MIKILKEKRDNQKSDDKKEKKKAKVVLTSLDPYEKLQMAIIMFGISFFTAFFAVNFSMS